MSRIEQALTELGAKPSQSEEDGLSLIKKTDLSIFCPGISSGGFAEIRMALENKQRNVVATTIDPKGLVGALENINELGLSSSIDAKLEDLRYEFPYGEGEFDFIYARLVLHYLPEEELDMVLHNFRQALKQGGGLYIVVRSIKNVEGKDYPYDPETKLTQEPWGSRYFHTPESIINHLGKAGFEVEFLKEFQEQLYIDFMRTKTAPVLDHVIELLAR